MNWLRNLREFIEEEKWIHWGILLNSLRNPSEFIEESEGIYWGIWVDSLRNMREFIEELKWINWVMEFEWIVDFYWICLIQMNLLNFKKVTNMILINQFSWDDQSHLCLFQFTKHYQQFTKNFGQKYFDTFIMYILKNI